MMETQCPDWIYQTGCRVVWNGEIVTYLGSPVGINITPSQEAEFLLNTIRKRTRHWANHLLSLQGRIVLLRHVLRAIPVYHLMALNLNKDGFKMLEGICREFVWGIGEQGNPKVPLVAWNTISTPTLEGGLSILNFLLHAALLKLWCASQLVEG